MSELKVGFARVDITPKLGTSLAGYYYKRYADGVLDPLLATAVVFDDGNKRAVVFAVDHLGLSEEIIGRLRPVLAQAAGTQEAGIFITCSHTHLAPLTLYGRNEAYVQLLIQKMSDAAVMAVADLQPATLSYTRALVHDVAFIRRFRMKDGSCQTNPGCQNPDIDHALGTPDEEASLLIINRGDAPQIGIAHFQVHPDTIGGTKISADFPYFIRRTYEKLVPNSLCMFINGTQGDTNSTDVRLSPDQPWVGYERTRYMGEKIAMSLIANIPLSEPMENTPVNYGEKPVTVRNNKAKSEQEIQEALEMRARYKEGGLDAIGPESMGMLRNSLSAQALRITSLMDQPDECDIGLAALRVGDMAFVGFPGEPFTEVGRTVKRGTKRALVLPSCCTNGAGSYYPTRDAYEYGSYEGMSARYAEGTAEQLAQGAIELVDSL